MASIPVPETAGPFHDFFSDAQSAIDKQIDALSSQRHDSPERKAAIERCLTAISTLNNQVAGAGDFLPAHDQRVLSGKLKALSERLRVEREGSAARPKFSFKAKLKPNAGSAGDGPTTSTAQSSTETRAPDGPQSINAQTSTAPDTVRISGRSRAVVSSQPPSTASSAVLDISNIAYAVVDTSSDKDAQTKHGSLAARDVHGSLLICGHVQGPVHLTHISHSVLLVACRQFRMHQAVDCDVYLHCTSRPIIEGCSKIRFAPLPPTLVEAYGVEGANMWESVDDFHWLRAEQSPNWAQLPASERLPDSTWLAVVSHAKDSATSSESILKDVGLE